MPTVEGRALRRVGVGATALTWAAAGVASARDRVAEAHRALRRDDSLQFSFEAAPVREPPPPGPRWLAALFDLLGPLLQVVFWAGVALIAALALWFLVREGERRWRERRGPAPGAAALVLPPNETRVRTLLAEADRLAAEGRYAEAVHVLLFRGVDDIRDQRPELFRRALTSREIAAMAALPARARSHFAALAEVVERSFFGGRAVDADGWARSRREYEAFAARDSWA
jgi:hypothetical protein